MTTARDAGVAEALTARGLDAREVAAKVALFARVADVFEAAGVRTPAWRAWVPGRLEIFGKHTDYAGGHSLVSAVPRGFAVAAAPRADAVVRVIDALNDQAMTIATNATSAAASGWRGYVRAIVSRFLKNFPGAHLGADIAIASDLPRAAGVSSSSALVVGVALAIARMSRLDERPEWLEAIRSREDLAGYFACLENGRTFGALAGDAGVGTHGGSEDHTAILCAKPGLASADRYVPVRFIDDVRVPPAWSIFIGTSGVAAEKTGAAQASYNRAADGVRRLLGAWNAKHPAAQSLAAALASNPGAADELRRDVSGDDALGRRLEHFIREDARVLAAVRAFRDADAGALGTLARASQDDAEKLLGNQVPETIDLAAIAHDCGAFAASSFGAGFGGSVWAAVSRDRAAGFGDRWIAAYRERHPDRPAIWFAADPAPGLIDIDAG